MTKPLEARDPGRDEPRAEVSRGTAAPEAGATNETCRPIARVTARRETRRFRSTYLVPAGPLGEGPPEQGEPGGWDERPEPVRATRRRLRDRRSRRPFQ